MYDRDKQDVHAGIRGRSAAVLCSYILGKMKVSPASPIWCIWSNSPRK